ncbi:MAG: ABC transporter ATP-binding protein [Anaerovoracaceae bacterium]
MKNEDIIAVQFKNVSKRYKLFKNEKDRLMSFFNNKIKYKTKKSLDNVSFEIKKGESVAFFGKNGAGKSTLLKIITGVTYPSDGIVRVNGRIGALLELTAGFDVELTGRENIYFRGDILGIKRAEMKQMEAEIVRFADLGDYIDQPVRTYSSGMRARLGFAINININPDILIVDEALSVGDREFREKCRNIISAKIEQGVTFLFVTHSILDAKKFCKRGIVMKNGHLVFDGDVKAAADFYINKLHPQKTKK